MKAALNAIEAVKNRNTTKMVLLGEKDGKTNLNAPL